MVYPLQHRFDPFLPLFCSPTYINPIFLLTLVFMLPLTSLLTLLTLTFSNYFHTFFSVSCISLQSLSVSLLLNLMSFSFFSLFLHHPFCIHPFFHPFCAFPSVPSLLLPSVPILIFSNHFCSFLSRPLLFPFQLPNIFAHPSSSLSSSPSSSHTIGLYPPFPFYFFSSSLVQLRHTNGCPLPKKQP